MIVWNYVAEEQAQDVRVVGNIICCVTEGPERLDRRKLRRRKRNQGKARVMVVCKEVVLGRKAFRKRTAIERSLKEEK